MGRRRRRVIKVVKRKLPTVFVCPKCGDEAVKVSIHRTEKRAEVKCGSCGLKGEYNVAPSTKMVDAYCKFTDEFYSGGIVKGEAPLPPPTPELAETPTMKESEESTVETETEDETPPVEDETEGEEPLDETEAEFEENTENA